MSAAKRRRSDEDFVEAAVSMVDRYGSADPGLGYTMVAAAELSGVGRQALYNHWDSIGDLTADIARYGVMVRPGWCHRLLAAAPDRSLAEAVRDAMAERDLAPGIRATASAWPVDHPARPDLVAWERSWFGVLGDWIEARLAAEGRSLPEGGDAELAAVATTAWADGCYFLESWFSGPQQSTWGDPAIHGGDFERATVWLDQVFPVVDDAPPGPVPGREFSMPPPLGPEMGAAKQRIVDALMDATLAAPSEDRPAPAPGRVVDLARLARELGVTERSLYNRWPQASDLNGDVFEFMLARMRTETEEHLAAALKLCWEQRFTSYDQLIIAGLGAMIEVTASRAPFTHFAMVVATLDDAVREPSAAFVRDWVDSLATSFLAIFAVSGWRMRDDFPVRKVIVPLFSAVIGLQRIASMHPELATRTRMFRGREVSALGYAMYAYLMGSITDEPFERNPSGGAAPPLAGLGGLEVDGIAG